GLKKGNSSPVCQVNRVTPVASPSGRPCFRKPDRPLLGRNRKVPGNNLFELRVPENAAVDQVQQGQTGSSDQNIDEILSHIRNGAEPEEPAQNPIDHFEDPAFETIHPIGATYIIELTTCKDCIQRIALLGKFARRRFKPVDLASKASDARPNRVRVSQTAITLIAANIPPQTFGRYLEIVLLGLDPPTGRQVLE